MGAESLSQPERIRHQGFIDSAFTNSAYQVLRCIAGLAARRVSENAE